MRKKLLKIMMKMMKFTPFFIRKKEFFDEIENIEKLAIAFGHPMCEGCENIIFDFPILMLKSAKNGYKLKFCNYKFFPKEAQNLGVKTTPCLFLKNGEKIEIISGDKNIKEKIKNFKESLKNY